MKLALCSLSVVLCLFTAPLARGADLSPHLETLRAVGPEGLGNEKAAASFKALSQAEVASLPQILAGLDGASPLAANWIRAAVESVADSAIKAGGKLPAAELEKFILDTKHDPRGRRLAFDLLARVDETARGRLIPGMLDDPSVELRRDAVRLQMDKANTLFLAKGQEAEAKVAYQRALASARDDDQIQIIVKRLGELGETVDLQRHFGFIATWHVIGPFDNTSKKGFNVAYPPESEIRLEAAYEGKEGQVRWEAASTGDTYGILDLNKVESQKHKGSVTYCLHEFTSDAARKIEIRLGTPNAWKVWLNGKLLFGRDEYHRGENLDQYQMSGELKAGTNQILVKLCQNEQTEDWAQRWQIRLRVCDGTGTAVLSTTRPPTPKKESKEEKKEDKKD